MVHMELIHVPQYHIYTFLAAAFLPCYFSSLERLGRATFSWMAKYYSALIPATAPALFPLALKNNMTNTAVPAIPGVVFLAKWRSAFFFFNLVWHISTYWIALYFACLWKQYKTGLALSQLAHLKQKQQQKTTHTFSWERARNQKQRQQKSFPVLLFQRRSLKPSAEQKAPLCWG